MIPELPQVSDSARFQFYDQLVSNLESQSTHHVAWFSHKRQPDVCWICDQQILMHKLMDWIERLLSKSAVDLDDSHCSEKEADSESDESDEDEGLDESQECVPEYDVEDEDD